MKKLLTWLLLCSITIPSMAQLKVGNNPTTLNASAALEVEHTSRGFLPPRLSTTQRNAIANPATGLVIFNTNNSSLEQNIGTASSPSWNAITMSPVPLVSNTTPSGIAAGQMINNTNAGSGLPVGPAWWDGTKWNTLISSNPTTTVFTNGAPSGTGQAGVLYVDSLSNSPTQGNQYIWDGAQYVSYQSPIQTPFYSQGATTDAAGDKLGVIYRPGQIGTGSTTSPDPSAQLDVNSTTRGFLPPRMTEVQMRAIQSPADGLIVYCIDCKPRGVYDYDSATTIKPPSPNGWGPLGSQTLGDATFVGSTISCSGALAGTYSLGLAMTSTNTKVVTINVASIGRYSATTDTVNGVVFTASGTLVTTGAGTQVVLRASGTPSAGGAFTYTLYLGGQTCTFSITFTAPATFNCTTRIVSNISPVTEVLMNGQSYNGTMTIPFTAGNGTSFGATTLNVNGLTLTRVAGTYSAGGGTITYNLSGTYTGETGPNAVIFTTQEGCSAQYNGLKYSAMANAGQSVQFENLLLSLPTSGNRSLQVATTTGTASLVGGGWMAFTGGSGGIYNSSIAVTTTPTYLYSAWGFPAAGDNQIMFMRNTTNNHFYKMELVVGPGYNNNQIRIERVDTTTLSTVVTGVVNAGVPITLGNIKVQIPTGNKSIAVSTTSGSMVISRGNFGVSVGSIISDNGVVYSTINSSAYSYIRPTWSFTAGGDYQRVFMCDTATNTWYKIEFVVGAGFNNNLLRIEKLTSLSGYGNAQTVNRAVPVTFNNLKAQLSATVSASNLQLATTSGSVPTQGAGDGHYYIAPGYYVTLKNITTTLNTGFITYGNAAWCFTTDGDYITSYFRDLTTNKFYRATLVIGPGYIKNLVMIERY